MDCRALERVALPPISAVAAGLDYAAAVAADGRLFAWGINRHARMGADIPAHVVRPALVEYDGAVVAAACSAEALVALAA